MSLVWRAVEHVEIMSRKQRSHLLEQAGEVLPAFARAGNCVLLMSPVWAAGPPLDGWLAVVSRSDTALAVNN